MKPRINLTTRLINLAGVAAAIYLLVILVQTVRGNASLQSQIRQQTTDIANLTQQNEDLKYQIAYYQTDAFKDKAAREKLGLQAPGEHLIILHPNSSPGAQISQPPTQTTPKKEAPNWVQWWHFLFG